MLFPGGPTAIPFCRLPTCPAWLFTFSLMPSRADASQESGQGNTRITHLQLIIDSRHAEDEATQSASLSSGLPPCVFSTVSSIYTRQAECRLINWHYSQIIHTLRGFTRYIYLPGSTRCQKIADACSPRGRCVDKL